MTFAKFLSYDPGQLTGVTYWELHDGIWVLKYTGTHILWHDIDKEIQADTGVAYEVVRCKHASFNPVGIEVMGVIQYLCEKNACPKFPQYPHQLVGPSHWTSVKNTLRLFPTQHEKDAYLHAVIYFSSNKLVFAEPTKNIRTSRKITS